MREMCGMNGKGEARRTAKMTRLRRGLVTIGMFGGTVTLDTVDSLASAPIRSEETGHGLTISQ